MEDSTGSHRNWRVTAAVAVSVAAVVALASLGGAGSAVSGVGLAQSQYGKKIAFCHKGKKTILVSVRAWPAHMRHGDTRGACLRFKKHFAKKHFGKKHFAKMQFVSRKHQGARKHHAIALQLERRGGGEHGKGAKGGESRRGGGEKHSSEGADTRKT